MRYRQLGKTGFKASILGLGGHEFLPDGRSRGFNEDHLRATTPGVLFEGFGVEKRKAVLRAAQKAGINFFDLTIDSEKEALARNLKEFPPSGEIIIQTRPEGMVYTNNPDDKFNWRMADYRLLRAEVARILNLLDRHKIDMLNLGFLAPALENDPEYLDKISRNVRSLKEENLIRFASADTFSGEEFYLKQIETGVFDSIFINFNVANDGGARKVLPAAAKRGMAVVAREIYMKGELFKMGEEAGITDRTRLAQAALRWALSNEHVSIAVVGADDPTHVAAAAAAADKPGLEADDVSLLDAVRKTKAYGDYHATRLKDFGLK